MRRLVAVLRSLTIDEAFIFTVLAIVGVGSAVMIGMMLAGK